jgi:hypothetical protein
MLESAPRLPSVLSGERRRSMKLRAFFTALLVALLCIGAATTALAVDPDSATQTIDISVLPTDTLLISVEEGFGFGPAVPGTPTEQRSFGMEVTNTTPNGWEVTVLGDDFLRFMWDGETCDQHGCYDRLPADDPPVTFTSEYLLVHGGSFANQGWEGGGPVTAYGIQLTQTPQTIMTATNQAYGRFGFDPSPYVQLDIPTGFVDYGDYYTTLTYTIQEDLL